MDSDSRERRQFERYDNEAKIYFRVTYDIRTKVKFQIVDDGGHESKKYSALSKNVSAEGICFASSKKLAVGDRLYLEVYLPRIDKPICMDGEVRWSRDNPVTTKDGDIFYTGVKLFDVNGVPVAQSIYYDKKHGVTWSTVLDSVFGSFSVLTKKKPAP